MRGRKYGKFIDTDSGFTRIEQAIRLTHCLKTMRQKQVSFRGFTTHDLPCVKTTDSDCSF